MRRLVLPLTLAFLASLFLAPAAVAQVQDTPQEDVAEELIEEILETPEQAEPVQEELLEAQQEAGLEQQTGVEEPAEVEDQKQTPAGGGQQQKQMPKQQKQMPKTGGIELNALLLPAIVLLMGTGILAAYGIRRYRRQPK